MHIKYLRNAFLGYAFLACGAVNVHADEGRELYLNYQCWQCHGYEGQGGAAPRIASTPYPFAAFAEFLRRPNVMPAYPPNLLDDAELRLIYDYVISIPAPPRLDEIPELNGD